jgi:hypothetical protein
MNKNDDKTKLEGMFAQPKPRATDRPGVTRVEERSARRDLATFHAVDADGKTIADEELKTAKPAGKTNLPTFGEGAQVSRPSSARKTLVDSSLLAAASAPVKQTVADPHIQRARLIGWLYSFSRCAEGFDVRIREGKTTIGSDPENDVVIAEDPKISKKHCHVVYRPSTKYLFVKDEGTTNGTYVNGNDIEGEQRRLQDGDELTVGDTVLILRLVKAVSGD